MSTMRKTAIIVGALFFVQTASYLFGDALFRSAAETVTAGNDAQGLTGVFLQFVNAAAVVGIGVLLFPVLRRFREGPALGYTATKIMESALLMVSALFAVLTVQADGSALGGDSGTTLSGPLTFEGYDLAFQLAMIALGAGSMFLMYLLYKFRLVPRTLSVLGTVGYIALFASGWLEIAGLDIAQALYIPGGLFEILFPLWLIIRGFSEAVPDIPQGVEPARV